MERPYCIWFIGVAVGVGIGIDVKNDSLAKAIPTPTADNALHLVGRY